METGRDSRTKGGEKEKRKQRKRNVRSLEYGQEKTMNAHRWTEVYKKKKGIHT